METYAFANQKGGVGKTTVTLGLAAALASQNLSVLLIDLDPQASATKVLGVDVRGTAHHRGRAARAGAVLAVVMSWSERAGASILRRRRPRSRRGSRGARRRMSSFSDGSWPTWSATTSRWWTVRRASAC